MFITCLSRKKFLATPLINYLISAKEILTHMSINNAILCNYLEWINDSEIAKYFERFSWENDVIYY